jgi:hypothetical protein
MTLFAWFFPVLLAGFDGNPGSKPLTDPGLELTGEDTLPPPHPSPNADARLVSGINAFGMAVFKQSAKASPHGNLILSPYALALSLNLSANGYSAPQAMKLRARLGQDSLDPREVDRFHAATLAYLLDTTHGVYARFAQCLWSRTPRRGE